LEPELLTNTETAEIKEKFRRETQRFALTDEKEKYKGEAKRFSFKVIKRS
jgi:hypothetical protein